MTTTKLQQDIVDAFSKKEKREPTKNEVIELLTMEQKYEFLYARILALEESVKKPVI